MKMKEYMDNLKWIVIGGAILLLSPSLAWFAKAFDVAVYNANPNEPLLPYIFSTPVVEFVIIGLVMVLYNCYVLSKRTSKKTD